ncbi:putative aromatic ring hydroxylating enzyme / PaaD-like protein [Streptococcus sp. DD10]|uniref:metal-sulfur cluster assembly factor n=1 Tax=Streptococcus sp. DD10 TaxID=1777878 RepID=UPI0007936C2C|nr:metal-sulfur cluster assembly factor [Streptococcus sp. DD10]KXT72715.1 putative aromatic ring hydroxylating enzyme / PaaD-like protein [Streptococcus sp. DD10]
MRDDIKINERALALEEQLIYHLERIYDTDVELDIYNLGLIYEIHLDETGTCKVVMTFTDTACDCAESLPIEVVNSLKKIDGIENVNVEVTWSPAWKITRISRFGRIALGISPR